MNKLLLLAPLLVGLLPPLLAQSPLPTRELEFHRRRTLELEPLLLRLEQAVDATRYDGPIGTARSSWDGSPATLVLTDGLEVQVNRLLARSEQPRTGPRAILRVTALRINDEMTSAMSFHRYYDVAGELAVQQDDGRFAIFGPARISGVGGRAGFPNDMDAGLTEALQRLVTRLAIAVHNESPNRTVDAIQARSPNEKFAVERLDPASLPDGRYASFLDFRSGAVDSTVQLVVDRENVVTAPDGEHYHWLLVSRPEDLKRRDLRDNWGLQRGGRSYVAVNGNYYEVRRNAAGEFRVLLPGDYLDGGVSAGSLVAMQFGLLGALVAGATEREQNAKRDNSPTVLFEFSAASGAFSPLESKSVSGRDTATVLLLANPQNLGRYGLRVALANDRVLPLAPGEFLFVPPGRACFRVESGAEECIELVSGAGTAAGNYEVRVTGKSGIKVVPMHRTDARRLRESAE